MNNKSLEDRIRDIVLDKLEKFNLDYDSIDIDVRYDIKTVGVQGDSRTYAHPVEIGVRKNREIVWNTDFMREMSTEITNQIKEINRVVYTIQ
ncbi:hypothetical protein HYT23_01715 [Candidatus Pacearchaeota archaeon]|nr:hypothetical protein [Candidatus Pacearchaeota archaeon]